MAAKLSSKKVTSPDNISTLPVDEEYLSNEEVFNMPAGYIDTDGTCHREFTLREMTGKDEEAVSKADVKSNGSKVVSMLLERCVKRIGSITRKSVGSEKWLEIIRSLYTGDQDYMVLKLRKISLGEELEFNHECPECKTKLKTFVNVDEIEVVPFKGLREIPFELPHGYRDSKGTVHKNGTMRLATGQDREILTPLATKNLAIATTTMLTRLCKFDDEDVFITDDVMRSLTIRDREYLQKLLGENSFGINPEIEVNCTSCGNVFTGKFTATNFI